MRVAHEALRKEFEIVYFFTDLRGTYKLENDHKTERNYA